MDEHLPIVETAAQLADRSRALMVLQLMDGSSKTSTELSLAANVSAPSASMHLAKLVDAKVLSAERVGRNKYYRIAGPAMAHAIEALAIAADLPLPSRSSPARPLIHAANPWAFARTCFDHLAGLLGVEITTALERREFVRQDGAGSYAVTEIGEDFFGELGIECEQLRTERRALAAQCLDWSERRSHMGGALGAALMNAM